MIYYCERCRIYYRGDDDRWWCPVCGRNGDEAHPDTDDNGDYDLSKYYGNDADTN